MSTSEKVTKFDNLVRSLNKIIFGREDEDVILDGVTKPTWSKWLKSRSSIIDNKADKSYVDAALGSFQMGSSKFYPTLSQANADIANIMPRTQTDVARDPVTVGELDNGGIWYKENYDSTSLTKSPYDPLEQVRNGEFRYIGSSDSENLYEFKDADGTVVLRLAKNGLLRSAQIDDLMLLLEAFGDFKQALKQTEDSKLLRFEDAEKNLLGYVDKFNNWVLNGMNINAEINALKSKKSGGAVNSGLKQIALKAPESLIQIYLTEVGDLPTAKGNTITGKAELHVDGQVFTAYINMEVQGSSSAAYAKKNWTFAFFSDRARTKSLDVKIGDLIPHDELVFKSNWIDHTNTRNVVAYRLWETMVATRKGYPKLEVEKGYIGKTGLDALQTGATGVPRLYPAVLYINDTFYGIGSLGIGKKRANYNIAKNKPTQIILGWEAWNDLQALETSGPVKYEFRAPSTPTNATYQAIADWNTFASLAVDSFKTEADKHLDKVNVIDFMLFVEFAYCDDLVRDNRVYNFLFISFDGKKFMFMPYDMDTIFGLHWSGGSISNDGTGSLLQNDLFWKKVIATYAPEMKSRYKELRDLGVFSVDSIYKMITNVSTTYPTSSQKDELEKWATKPSINITSAEQISGWISKRIQFLDTYFNYVA